MPEPHAPLDHLLFAVIAVISPVVDRLWVYPRLKRATEAGAPGARSRFYLAGMLTQWMLTACVLALWVAQGRAWSGLWMGPSSAKGAAIGLGIVVAVLGLLLVQRRAFLGLANRLDVLRRQVGPAMSLLPHTRPELSGFRALAVTAGICEEVLFRGYVFWYLAMWLSTGWSIVVSSILFGFAHVYLDRRSAVRAGIVGAVMALVVWLTGALWWAMILHAAIDLNSGDISFRALTEEPEAKGSVGAAPVQP